MSVTDNRLGAVTVIVPGDLETRTGGYGYDRRMISGLRAIGWNVRPVRLDDTFPWPTAAARGAAAAALAAIPDGEVTLIDGLALGALPEEARAHASRVPIVALVHHPLALETGLSAEQAARLEASERRALTAARHVVVTSRATAETLSRFDVEPARITTIEPGTDPAPLARIHREHPTAETSQHPTAEASQHPAAEASQHPASEASQHPTGAASQHPTGAASKHPAGAA